MPKILGICGSPRKGATEYAVREALKSAEEIPGITTEFWSVRGKISIAISVIGALKTKLCVLSKMILKDWKNCFLKQMVLLLAHQFMI